MLYRRFAYALSLLLALVFVGAWGYTEVEGWSFSDGLYMTVITVGTIGYGETNPLTPPGRVYTMLLILFSTGVMVYATSSLTAIIVEGEIQNLFARRKLKRMIARMQGHFLVCGDSTIGQHIVEELSRTGQPFIVIDRNAEKIARLSEAGIAAIQGDATLDATLREAGIERAAGLVTCLHTDADNLFVVLTARRLNTGLRIIAKALEPGSREKLQQVGADGVVMPEAIGGLRMASELIRPHVVSFLDVMLRAKDQTIRVEEVPVSSSTHCAGKTLAQCGLDNLRNASLVAVSRPGSGYQFNPPGSWQLQSEDVLILLGETSAIADFRQSLLA